MEEKKKIKWIPIFKALIFSYVITTVLLLLLAFLVYKLELSDKKLDIGILLIQFFSCFLGGFLIGKSCRVHRFLWGMLIGSIYVLVLVLVATIIGNETLGSIANVLLTAAVCLGSGALGGMMS